MSFTHQMITVKVIQNGFKQDHHFCAAPWHLPPVPQLLHPSRACPEMVPSQGRCPTCFLEAVHWVRSPRLVSTASAPPYHLQERGENMGPSNTMGSSGSLPASSPRQKPQGHLKPCCQPQFCGGIRICPWTFLEVKNIYLVSLKMNDVFFFFS